MMRNLTKRRCLKKLNDEEFNKDLQLVPFHAAYVFKDIAGFQCHVIQNKNQNHSIDKVQILRKERR